MVSNSSSDKPFSAEGVPKPQNPEKRTEPLPGQRPKESAEDPQAKARLEVLIQSPSYRRADQDSDFLTHPDARGPRLELDFLKPEVLLRAHGVEETIVVFGSTRIPEPAESQRRVLESRQALAQKPKNLELQRKLRIAERVQAKSRFYEEARELGRIVGQAGKGPKDSQLVLMTGGGPGIMEAANRGAFDVGAETIGLNITLPHEQYPNPYISPELCFQVHYFAIRKLHFLLRAKALVVFPGGYGTLDELFETLMLIQTRKMSPLPVILVGREFWNGVFDADFLVDEGVIAAEDLDLFWYAETAQEIWQGITYWHNANGTPLFGH